MFRVHIIKCRTHFQSYQFSVLTSIRFQSSNSSQSPSLPPALLERARRTSSEHAQLLKKLADGFETTIAKKVGELSTAAKALEDWEIAAKSLSELQQLMQDPLTDSELRSLAAEEIQSTSANLHELSNHLRRSLVPPHPFSHLPCLVEIRPGAGGSEAAIFVGDLLRMYQALCKRRHLRCKIIKQDTLQSAGAGSGSQISEVVIEIEEDGAYDFFRCEAGVHRVQRVPATENNGRTHTSAASVMVLPSFPNDGKEELGANSFDNPTSDYYIDPKEVKTELMRARGAGGQHVNTTESAVRLTHIPTNTVVSIQDSRSQHKNREQAWQLLRARIAQARREAREEERVQLRLSVIGIAKMGRGDKIRTYNWSQQRVTDHRSGITMHHLADILEGGTRLDEVMDSVKVWLRERDLESLIAEDNALSKAKSTKAK